MLIALEELPLETGQWAESLTSLQSSGRLGISPGAGLIYSSTARPPGGGGGGGTETPPSSCRPSHKEYFCPVTHKCCVSSEARAEGFAVGADDGWPDDFQARKTSVLEWGQGIWTSPEELKAELKPWGYIIYGKLENL